MDNIYIHYGHKKFEKDKFIEIQNQLFNKPIGGLWASSLNSKYGWKEWNESEKLVECNEFNSFKFQLKKDARILEIDSHEVVLKLPVQGKYDMSCCMLLIDFEKIKNSYDAIEFLVTKDRQLYWDLYGWDCDSILILNKECIVEVK